jgi:hypothetical protein
MQHVIHGIKLIVQKNIPNVIGGWNNHYCLHGHECSFSGIDLTHCYGWVSSGYV